MCTHNNYTNTNTNASTTLLLSTDTNANTNTNTSTNTNTDTDTNTNSPDDSPPDVPAGSALGSGVSRVREYLYRIYNII